MRLPSDGPVLHRNSVFSCCLLFLVSLTTALEFTVCTTVMNEVDYMVEWIEFLALQNVTRVVVGDHWSRDGLRHLAAFYRHRSPEVVVLPNSGEQTPFLDACGRRHASSDWLAFLDNDEFPWSPRHGSLLAYLETLPKDVTQVHAFDLRFGVGSWRRRPRVRVTNSAVRPLNHSRYQLVTEHHVRRAPSLALGERLAYRRVMRMRLPACNGTQMQAIYGPAFRGSANDTKGFCGLMTDEANRLGKSFVRGYAFGRLGHPHYAQLKKGISHRETDLRQLRINHYFVRSRQDAYKKARQWAKHDPVEWVEQALPLQHAVRDDSLCRAFVPRLKMRLQALDISV